MRRITFDLDVLRSFTLGVELGSFARAAERLGRSTSAVSAQLKKLEEQVGAPVLRKAGRNMVPTHTGEVLLAYARRLLELNDEASHAVHGTDLAGILRAVPRDVPLSLEIPMQALTRTLPAVPRARQMLDKARRLLASLD